MSFRLNPAIKFGALNFINQVSNLVAVHILEGVLAIDIGRNCQSTSWFLVLVASLMF
jgi:hypothetical protein